MCTRLTFSAAPRNQKQIYLNSTMRPCRGFSGVPRRLFDGSNNGHNCGNINKQQQAGGATSYVSGCTSSSPCGTLASIHSNHSASSSNGSNSNSSHSGAVIFQCTTGSGQSVVDSSSQQQQQQQHQQITASSPNGHDSSPRLGNVMSSDAIGSLAASPTDACSIRSNPSAASLLLSTSAAAAEASALASATTVSVSGATLSPLATTQIIRRPSITLMWVELQSSPLAIFFRLDTHLLSRYSIVEIRSFKSLLKGVSCSPPPVVEHYLPFTKSPLYEVNYDWIVSERNCCVPLPPKVGFFKSCRAIVHACF